MPAQTSPTPAISTINEDFYNNIGHYISDTEHSDDICSIGSSDTPDPFTATACVSPNTSRSSLPDPLLTPNTHKSFFAEQATSFTERTTARSNVTRHFSLSPKQQQQQPTSIGNAIGGSIIEYDPLTLSERSMSYTSHDGGSKDTTSSSARDTSKEGDHLLVSERTTRDASSKNNNRDHTGKSNDQLLISERTTSTKLSKSSGSKREIDPLMLSERSGGTKHSYSRRDYSEGGYDSLAYTTDETHRKMAAFPEDDSSSISSTHSTPFPHLIDNSASNLMIVEEYNHHDDDVPSPSGRELLSLDLPLGDDPPDGGSHSNHHPGVAPRRDSRAGELSQQIIDLIEGPPLGTPEAAAAATHNAGAAKQQTPQQQQRPDPEGKYQCQSPVGRKKKKWKGIGTKKKKAVGTPSDSDCESSISSSSSGPVSLKERADRIPRRWLFDRIDGTVRVSPQDEDEEDSVPAWRQKPPTFLCLPSPLVRIFPRWLEENPCCVTVGTWGCLGGRGPASEDAKATGGETGNPFATSEANITVSADSADLDARSVRASKQGFLRALVLGVSLLLNVLGLLATMLSGMALTRSSPGLLEAAPFGRATSFDGAVTLYLGLLAIGIHDPENNPGGKTVVVGFRDFCATPSMEDFLEAEACESCSNTSVWVIVGFFLATVAYLPSFAIGIGRLYENYDTNCSKVALGVWSLVSLAGYSIVLSCYYASCLDSLYDGQVWYTSVGDVYGNMLEIPTGQGVRTAEIRWEMGAAQALFLVGLALKIVDLVAGCCVATPPIARSRELQWIYEDERVSSTNDPQETRENGNPQEGSGSARGLTNDALCMNDKGTEEATNALEV